MATTPAIAPEPQGPINHLGRIFGVLFSPKATYEDIVRRPTWVAPLVVLIVLSLVASVIFVQKVDWREVISQQIDNNPRAAQMSADQKQQQIEMGSKFAPVFGYVGGLVFPVVLLLIMALVMWGAYAVMSGVNAGFGTAMAITSHAFMTSIISTPVFLLILFLKPSGTIDVENPMATNLAAFLPEGVPKWLSVFGRQIDVFTIWTLILIAIGFSVINTKKLKLGSSLGVALGVFAVWVVLRTGIAFIFS